MNVTACDIECIVDSLSVSDFARTHGNHVINGMKLFIDKDGNRSITCWEDRRITMIVFETEQAMNKWIEENKFIIG
jgi:hypothetical protein